jgi:hypothetical protein
MDQNEMSKFYRGPHLIKQIVVFCAIYNLFLLRLRYTSRPGGTGIIKMAMYEFPD